MRPFGYELINEMPLTTSGKVDRRALSKLVPEMALMTCQKRKPITDSQLRICKAFEAILGVSEIGLDDNFFVIGGSSLDAMRLLVSLNAEFGATITAKDIFGSPTAEGISRILSELDQGTSRRRKTLRKGLGVKRNG